MTFRFSSFGNTRIGLPSYTSYRYHYLRLRTMSTQKDTSQQSDISTMTAHTADGSFKRAPSSFRNTIEKGGQFEVEKGGWAIGL